jgi:hypothetical protein
MSSPVVVSRIQNRRGTQAQFNGANGIYPPGYDGIGGFGSIPGYDIVNYPSVLLPGELALCTDTRRTFLGNINGEFLELTSSTSTDILLSPLMIELPPAAIFTVITGLSYIPTPFTKILYDVTDSLSTDWNQVGTSFSRNGQLEITAVAQFSPISNPPFPDITPVNITDTGTEINRVEPNTITFKAQYDISSTYIDILYMHDFSGNLTFSTSSIKWLPF